MYAGKVCIPVHRYTMPLWSRRDWRCRVGLHRHGELTEDDIASASKVCERCGKVWHFPAVAMIECIMARKYMLIRENGPPVASRAAESSPPSSERASSRDEPETPNPEPSAS